MYSGGIDTSGLTSSPGCGNVWKNGCQNAPGCDISAKRLTAASCMACQTQSLCSHAFATVLHRQNQGWVRVRGAVTVLAGCTRPHTSKLLLGAPCFSKAQHSSTGIAASTSPRVIACFASTTLPLEGPAYATSTFTCSDTAGVWWWGWLCSEVPQLTSKPSATGAHLFASCGWLSRHAA